MKTTVNSDLLQVGTMVRMAGVIGGLRVEEIDREGDRVMRVSDGSCYLVRGSSRDFASPPAMGLCAVPVEKEADHA